MESIPKEIEAHYLEDREADRLRAGAGQLEFVRTQSVLARALPPPPAVVLDIGGAAGIHAIPLASRGYQVSLIDPMALHLRRAESAARDAGVRLASIEAGDARGA